MRSVPVHVYRSTSIMKTASGKADCVALMTLEYCTPNETAYLANLLLRHTEFKSNAESHGMGGRRLYPSGYRNEAGRVIELSEKARWSNGPRAHENLGS